LRVTIKDLARELGVAVSTVSRALNGSYGVHPSTIARVHQKAEELGYIPDLGAKQLVGKKSHLIGVFTPEFESEVSPEFVEFFPPLHKLLRMHGKDVIIFSVPVKEYSSNQLNEWIVQRKLEGCVFMPAFSNHHPLMKDALALGVPCVNFGNTQGPRCSLVRSDDREGGRLAARLLLSSGHSKIGYIAGPRHLHHHLNRYGGFCEELRLSGVVHDATWVSYGDYSGSSGARAALELWERSPKMTALFCENDLMAMGAITALAQAGVRVPEEFSVIGYDGAFFTAYMNPPLTTLRHHISEIVIHATDLLLELLAGGEGRTVVIAPQLIERKSVLSRVNR
jgi:LacI family transcriptional regulator